MWDNLLRRRITKLSIVVGSDAQRTRDNRSNQNRSQSSMRSLVNLNSVIQKNDLDHGPWPYRHMAGLKAWLLLNPVAGSRRVGSPMMTLIITGKVPPPVTIANVSPSNGLGLRLVLAVESFVSIRIGG